MRAFLAVMVVLFGGTPALADDSSAALGAGGIVLTKQADIRMESEDLAISPKQVRVRFVFANDTDKDVDTIVAFPLPDIDTATYWGSPVGAMTRDPANFIGFRAFADGKPVAFKIEQRAFVKGKDVTARIVAVGAPLNPAVGEGYRALEKLARDKRQRLMGAGIAMGDATEFVPQWIVRTKFYWPQRFPAHKRVVITHSYQPVTGQSFFSPADSKRTDKYGAVDYCIDAPTWTAIEARSAASRKANPGNNGYLNAFETDYILKTGNNWKGPIGRFRLTLDKLRPENLMSLCWGGRLRRTGAATYEAARENFAPARDIELLVLQ